MFGLGDFGKVLLIFGAVIAGVGVLLMVADKIPWLGKLPGDILIRKGKFTFYFPIVTCVILSILLTIIFSLLRK